MLVGLSNVGLCFFCMYLGSLFGLNYLLYTVLGYLITIIYSFYMNLRFTFQVSGNISKRFQLFFLINLTNLALVEAIEYTLIDILKWNHYLSIFSAMVWYAVSGFICNRIFVYSKRA